MARPRSDIQPRILHAARARFLADGVDGASLRQIASDAQTSIGMVYYYFPTKEELFLAVVEEIYARVLDDLARALAPDVAVEERLHRLYVRLGKLSEEEVTILRLVARELLVSSERRERLMARFLRGHVPLLLSTIMDGVRAGVLTDRAHPVLVGITAGLVGLLPQVVLKAVGERFPAGLGLPRGEALSHALADLVLQGIRGKPPAQ
jgi:AcrR family transcriptional regulator